MNKRKFRLIAISASIGLTFTALTLPPAWAVPDYPTAAEVAAAKRNVEAKKAMIKRIEAIIAEQEKEAAALGAIAMEKNKQYTKAKQAVDQMRSKVQGLQAQVSEAADAAATAKIQLGQIAARMYREGTTGDPTLQIFFDPKAGEDLLYRLGAQEIIAERTDAIYQASIQKQAEAEALANELAAAQAELEIQEAATKKIYLEAKSAQDAALAKVSESEKENRTMLTQLASLQDQAEDLERQRREGLAAEARQNAIKTAPTAPELYSVSDPNTTLVERAIAYASDQLGERYVLGGSGPDIWDCSGITMRAYQSAGVYIGWHSATAQYNVLASAKKLVPFQQAKRGDLIWWSREQAFSGDKYHVAIYLGDGMMLEAPNPARTVRIVPVRYGELWPYAGRPTAD
jgi:cell wall-associated NlpC family hydrolase